MTAMADADERAKRWLELMLAAPETSATPGPVPAAEYEGALAVLASDGAADRDRALALEVVRRAIRRGVDRG